MMMDAKLSKGARPHMGSNHFGTATYGYQVLFPHPWINGFVKHIEYAA